MSWRTRIAEKRAAWVDGFWYGVALTTFFAGVIVLAILGD